MSAPPAARLARAVIGYLVLMIAIVTLAPFRFAPGPVHGLQWIWAPGDMVLNVVLFVPVGFVLQLGRPRGERAALLPALALGAAISAAIETAQLFAPDRFPSVADLLTNALGAALGAHLAARATRRTDGAETVRAFALDLPLVGLTYLLVPVLWLGGLSSGPAEALLLVLPAMAAAWIMASVQAAYAWPVATTGSPLRRSAALGGALFVMVGFLPALPFAPAALPWGALAFALTVFARRRAPLALTHEHDRDGGAARRFEAPTLRAALVPLVAFIILHALWPLDAAPAPWSGTFALLPAGTLPDAAAVLRVMAHASAFTALGYAIAEHRGRAHEALRAIAPRVVGWGAALAVPLEVARGFRAGTTASALVPAICVTAALFGAWLFGLQLRNVQALLGRAPRPG